MDWSEALATPAGIASAEAMDELSGDSIAERNARGMRQTHARS